MLRKSWVILNDVVERAKSQGLKNFYVTSIAIVENAVLNLRRSKSFTSKIWKSTRTICQTFLRNSTGHFRVKTNKIVYFPASFLASFVSVEREVAI